MDPKKKVSVENVRDLRTLWLELGQTLGFVELNGRLPTSIPKRMIQTINLLLKSEASRSSRTKTDGTLEIEERSNQMYDSALLALTKIYKNSNIVNLTKSEIDRIEVILCNLEIRMKNMFDVAISKPNRRKFTEPSKTIQKKMITQGYEKTTAKMLTDIFPDRTQTGKKISGNNSESARQRRRKKSVGPDEEYLYSPENRGYALHALRPTEEMLRQQLTENGPSKISSRFDLNDPWFEI